MHQIIKRSEVERRLSFQTEYMTFKELGLTEALLNLDVAARKIPGAFGTNALQGNRRACSGLVADGGCSLG